MTDDAPSNATQSNFIKEATSWKRDMVNNSEVWVRNKARRIVQRYIKTGAPLEINISGNMRRAVVAWTEKERYPSTMFDDSVDEIARLLMTGPFRVYVVRHMRGAAGGRGDARRTQAVGAFRSAQANV